ncbi:MAG: 50S ribosomal protein L6 [candidate division Zixibacteria bacterium]|nr:50S ribosomal protein L6 [candidate division Zixibacteria bacterium]
MSRIGKAPVTIPDKTKIEITGNRLDISGPKGTLQWQFPADIAVAVDGKQVVVTRASDQKKHRALHGLTRALIANMFEGVSVGFKRQLKIIGVGYRAEIKGKCMICYLGYSHPLVVQPPEGIKLEVEPKENIITISGVDKGLVGAMAAKIRSLRPPEPYKGKGVRYIDEHVTIKAGKTAA